MVAIRSKKFVQDQRDISEDILNKIVGAPRGCRDQYTGPEVGREGRPQAAKFFLVYTYFTLNYGYL